MNSILEKTLSNLLGASGVSARTIRSVHLNNYFTVVELDDGSVGACMSCYSLNSKELANRQSFFRSMIDGDPLLLRHVAPGTERDDMAACVRAAVVNALSAPVLRSGRDASFVLRRDFPHHLFSGVRYAVVIGFGGFLPYIVRHTTIPVVHVSDLSYHERRTAMDGRIERYRKEGQGIDLSISDGSDIEKHLKKADFVSITGSTLVNGTLDRLLHLAQGCPKIILQGQSASIHPGVCFASGVHMVATTIGGVKVFL